MVVISDELIEKLASFDDLTSAKYSSMFFDGVTMKTSCFGVCVESSSTDLLMTFLLVFAAAGKHILIYDLNA